MYVHILYTYVYVYTYMRIYILQCIRMYTYKFAGDITVESINALLANPEALQDGSSSAWLKERSVRPRSAWPNRDPSKGPIYTYIIPLLLIYIYMIYNI